MFDLHADSPKHVFAIHLFMAFYFDAQGMAILLAYEETKAEFICPDRSWQEA